MIVRPVKIEPDEESIRPNTVDERIEISDEESDELGKLIIDENLTTSSKF